MHVKNGIGDTLDDGLADVEVIARQAPQARLHPLDQFKRRAAGWPIALRMQQDIGFDVGGRERLRALVVTPELADDMGDLRKFPQGPSPCLSQAKCRAAT